MILKLHRRTNDRRNALTTKMNSILLYFIFYELNKRWNIVYFIAAVINVNSDCEAIDMANAYEVCERRKKNLNQMIRQKIAKRFFYKCINALKNTKRCETFTR